MQFVATDPSKFPEDRVACRRCRKTIALILDDQMVPSPEECYLAGNIPIPNFGWLCSRECAERIESEWGIKFSRNSAGEIDYYKDDPHTMLSTHLDHFNLRQKVSFAIYFLKLALPVWNKYADENDLTYRDTVVGLDHRVHRNLLNDTVKAVEKYDSLNRFQSFINGKHNLMQLRSQFDDPIVALQDDDWSLPEPVLSIFFSVYNLLNSYFNNKNFDSSGSGINVSIHQAVDAVYASKILSFANICEITLNFRFTNK